MPVAPVFAQCLFCGSPFEVTAKHPTQKFCSTACSGTVVGRANRKEKPFVLCRGCGTPFQQPQGRELFCSRSCASKHRAPGPTTPAADRFWAKVDKTGNCWVWTGGTNEGGYGIFHPVKGTTMIATHFAWGLENGPVPRGLNVLHRCDNPPCCRVEHLFLGTVPDNNRDMVEKGRQAKGERVKMAKLTEASVREIRARYAAGERVGVLAREFSVSHAAVSLAAHRVTWRHVD